jgi:hypothetical protein
MSKPNDPQSFFDASLPSRRQLIERAEKAKAELAEVKDRLDIIQRARALACVGCEALNNQIEEMSEEGGEL